jgi:hypothetical protein
MPHNKSFWYKVGFALEKALQAPSSGGKALASLKDRRESAQQRTSRKIPSPESWPTADELVASGMAAVAGRVLEKWHPRGGTSVVRLVRAGASGAAAAFLVEFLRPLAEGRIEAPDMSRELADRVLVGAGQGLVYGSLVEPRVPGPAAVKGAVYGSAEYAVDPMGGLSRLLGPHSPQGRLPVVAHLLDDLDRHDRAYMEHVVFGIALALLYGSSRSNSGMRIEVDDDG